jgi:hypothetical protein
LKAFEDTIRCRPACQQEGWTVRLKKVAVEKSSTNILRLKLTTLEDVLQNAATRTCCFHKAVAKMAMRQSSSSIRVEVRVRPLTSNENNQTIAVQATDDNTVVVTSSKDKTGGVLPSSTSQQTFTYDHVSGTDVSQEELYNQTAAPLLKSFMGGYKYVMNRSISVLCILFLTKCSDTPLPATLCLALH